MSTPTPDIPMVLGTETLMFPNRRVRRVVYADTEAPAVYHPTREELHINADLARKFSGKFGPERAAAAIGFLVRHELWHSTATWGWPKDLPTKAHYTALQGMEDIRNNRSLLQLDRSTEAGMQDAHNILHPTLPEPSGEPLIDFLNFLTEASTQVGQPDFPDNLKDLAKRYPTSPGWAKVIPKIAKMSRLNPDLFDQKEAVSMGLEATEIQLDILRDLAPLMPQPKAAEQAKSKSPAKPPGPPAKGPVKRTNQPGDGAPYDGPMPEEEDNSPAEPADQPVEAEDKEADASPSEPQEKSQEKSQEGPEQEPKEPKDSFTAEDMDKLSEPATPEDAKSPNPSKPPPPKDTSPPKPSEQPPKNSGKPAPQQVQGDTGKASAADADGNQIKQALMPVTSQEAAAVAKGLNPIVNYVTGMLATGMVIGAGEDPQYRSPKFREQGNRLNIQRFVRSKINPAEQQYYSQDIPGAQLNKGGKKNHLKYLLIGGLSRCTHCCDIEKSRYITAIIYLAAHALGVKPLYCASRNGNAYPVLEGLATESTLTHLPNLLNSVSADPKAQEADDHLVFEYLTNKSKQLRNKDPRVGILLFDDECTYDPACSALVAHGAMPAPTLRLSFNKADGLEAGRKRFLESLPMPTLLVDGDDPEHDAAILHLTLKHITDFLKQPQAYLATHRKGMRHVNRESLAGVPNSYPKGFPELLAVRLPPTKMVDPSDPSQSRKAPRAAAYNPDAPESHASGCSCGQCSLGMDV